MAFWRFFVDLIFIMIYNVICIGEEMKEPRVSIRLSEEDHIKFKIIATKKKKTMQGLLFEYVKKLIKEDKDNE